MALTVLVVILLAIVCNLTVAESVPKGWTHYRADPDARIPLRFSLAQLNLDKLETFLLEIADPRSYKYGQHCSAVKVKETFQPSAETVETVYAWLTYDGGIHEDRIKLSSNGDILQLNLTIAEAEGLLQSEYYVYGDEDGAVHLGCHDGYTLPEHVSKHVDFVWPTIHFGGMSSLSRGSDSISLASSFFGQESGASKMPIEHLATFAEAGCDTSVTLDCLRSLYKFDFEPVSSDVNTVGAVEFGKNIYRPSDLDLFFESYSPDQVGRIPTLISVEEGSWLRDPTASGDVSEGSLDIEIMMGLLGPRQNYPTSDPGFEARPEPDPPSGLTRAWVGLRFLQARDPGLSPGLRIFLGKFMARLCTTEFNSTMTWFIRGVVISCVSAGPAACFGAIAPVAYQKLSQADGARLCTRMGEHGPFGSGLGFFEALTRSSPTLARALRPDPTRTTLDRIFLCTRLHKRIHPWTQVRPSPAAICEIFNLFGEATALSVAYPLVIAEKGRFVHTGGTSASAPIFASLIAGVNDARLAEGKSPVGFINPAFYSPAFTGAFNDVTVGSNPGCQTEGFPAAPGWDPVNGLGIKPNFEKLKAAFLALP
ncbi:Pro-kumamolisin, activation domain-containing protein [Mycena galopus ATCC 62051]|nr:Pro-kumamolisin, activation domain-containing protein [Mycena galopus ATCC 62051]